MPLQIIREDITRMRVDAIVNPSNEILWPGGGTDAAIHKAAGSALLSACQALGGCKVGEAKITNSFKLPSKYVIHTVGPVWRGGLNNEKEKLISCYRESLKLAKENDCESIAIPLISSGTYGYPKDSVLKIAIQAVSEFLFTEEMMVYIVVFDKKSYSFSEKLFSDIKAYIDDSYVDEHSDFYTNCKDLGEERPLMNSMPLPSEKRCMRINDGAFEPGDELEKIILELDEPFSVKLLKLIDEKGFTDVECYKKSNVSKKTFWKIVNQKGYKPSKNTVLSFAIGLELNLDETLALLKTVGLTLSSSEKFDVVIKYFIEREVYNIFDINEALFELDLPCLGGAVS